MSRIERKILDNSEEADMGKKQNKANEMSFISFILALSVAIIADILGIFLGEIPFVGAFISFSANSIIFSIYLVNDVKFNPKRITSMLGLGVAELFPFVSNLPLISLNVILTRYLN